MKAIGARKQARNGWQKVFDAHKPPRRVRGLWRRGEEIYANLNASNGNTYFYPLHMDTVPQAVVARQALKSLQAEDKLLPPSGLDTSNTKKPVPKAPASLALAEAVAGYQKSRDTLKCKDEATCAREDSGLKLWVEKFGTMAFADVKSGTLTDFAEWRMECVEEINEKLEEEGSTRKPAHLSGRTIDLNVLALNHVRDWAIEKRHLPEDMPVWKWKKMAGAPAPDELLTPEQMDELCNQALLDPETLKLLDPRYVHLQAANAASGQYFHDYMRLLQHSGARENETTEQQWPNVTWSGIAKHDGDGSPDFKKGDRIPGKLFFPGKFAKAGGGKPAEDRWVTLHQDLDEHLQAMYARRDPSSDWMFPKRRGAKGHTLRFHRQLERVKRELREKNCEPGDEKFYWFDRVTFQWFRHYFISHAVMAGIDFKTIAHWVSHRDGGVLIGKLYGHHDERQMQQMSAKMTAHLLSRR